MVNRLIVENLSAGYGAVSVLRDVSIEINESEFVALLGTNGNGKTTLLNSILGLVPAKSGKILLEWNGVVHDLTKTPPEQVANHGIALVPEGRRLFPGLTVEENLILGGSGPRAKANLKRNLEFVYSTFPLLKERHAQKAGTMSGGQQQLLAIGRAMMLEPVILLIDEPSVGLAPIAVDLVLKTIQQLQEETNLTVLMAEQSVVQAIQIASRSYLISHGRIAEEMDRRQAAQSADEIRSLLLGVD